MRKASPVFPVAQVWTHQIGTDEKCRRDAPALFQADEKVATLFFSLRVRCVQPSAGLIRGPVRNYILSIRLAVSSIRSMMAWSIPSDCSCSTFLHRRT